MNTAGDALASTARAWVELFLPRAQGGGLHAGSKGTRIRETYNLDADRPGTSLSRGRRAFQLWWHPWPAVSWEPPSACSELGSGLTGRPGCPPPGILLQEQTKGGERESRNGLEIAPSTWSQSRPGSWDVGGGGAWVGGAGGFSPLAEKRSGTVVANFQTTIKLPSHQTPSDTQSALTLLEECWWRQLLLKKTHNENNNNKKHNKHFHWSNF